MSVVPVEHSLVPLVAGQEAATCSAGEERAEHHLAAAAGPAYKPGKQPCPAAGQEASTCSEEAVAAVVAVAGEDQTACSHSQDPGKQPNAAGPDLPTRSESRVEGAEAVVEAVAVAVVDGYPWVASGGRWKTLAEARPFLEGQLEKRLSGFLQQPPQQQEQLQGRLSGPQASIVSHQGKAERLSRPVHVPDGTKR